MAPGRRQGVQEPFARACVHMRLITGKLLDQAGGGAVPAAGLAVGCSADESIANTGHKRAGSRQRAVLIGDFRCTAPLR